MDVTNIEGCGKKTKVAVLLTCFNRKEQTRSCIETLVEKNKSLDMRFVVADDNSQDGTCEMLKELSNDMGYHIHIIEGDGSLFWAGGMRKSLGYALTKTDKFDYALLVNDDVLFYDGAIEKMIERLDESGHQVMAGATCDKEGSISYGCVNKKSSFFAKFELLEPSEEIRFCDTFNCNCVLIDAQVFKSAGNIDSHYVHSMGDFDYGLTISGMGYKIINSAGYVGQCEDNDVSKSWRNKNLPRKERLKMKEGPKGLPRKDWFYFVKKNFGIVSAVYHTLTPYVRILLGV